MHSARDFPLLVFQLTEDRLVRSSLSVRCGPSSTLFSSSSAAPSFPFFNRGDEYPPSFILLVPARVRFFPLRFFSLVFFYFDPFLPYGGPLSSSPLSARNAQLFHSFSSSAPFYSSPHLLSCPTEPWATSRFFFPVRGVRQNIVHMELPGSMPPLFFF